MLYSVPKVFVTDDGAIVVARGERAARADDTDWRGVALRMTDLSDAVRATCDVFVALRDDAGVRALRVVVATDAIWVVAPRVGAPLRATVVRAPRDAVSDCETDVRFDDAARADGTDALRAITDVLVVSSD